jgi:glutaredoxin
MSIRITFYTKPNCPLCEDAEELLEEMRGHFDFSVFKIDITKEMETYEIFKHRIPVLRLGDLWELSGRISEKELKQKIEAFLKKRK